MNKLIKKKWVKALRSGEYKQGRYCLVNNKDQFCCLGVLANIYAIEKGGAWEKDEFDDWSYDGAESYLPSKIRIWAGLKSPDPTIKIKSISNNISWFNDGGIKFKTLANAIEKQL